MRKKHGKQEKDLTFSHFMVQPHVSAALVSFALIGLMLSLIEFTNTVSF